METTKATTPKLRYALSLRSSGAHALTRSRAQTLTTLSRSARVRAQAASAHPRAERAPGHRHTAHLQVGLKPPVDPVLGVTDVVSVLRLLAANRASLGHESPSEGELIDKNEARPGGAHRRRF